MKKYETIVAKAVAAGISLSNYESTVGRDQVSSSEDLNGFQFL